VLKHTGKSYTHPEIIARHGPSEVGIIKMLVPDEVWEESCQTFIEEYDRIHRAHNIGAYPGINPILKLLAEYEIRQAIVTGKGAESAKISLNYFQLNGHFEYVETGWLTGSSKEACIKKVVGAWQLSPQSVLYIGDALSDIAIARRAGVRPVSAAWADTADPEELLAEGPEALFETISALEDWLRNQLNEKG
jgi:phosphoglycolate phosphatase/pyrophosphatase PpaX